MIRFSTLNAYKTALLSIVCTLGYLSDGMAQSPSFEYHDREFRCHFAKDAMKTLENQSDDSLRHQLQVAIQETKKGLQDPQLERQEKKSLKTHLGLLQSIQKIQSPKSEMQLTFQRLCNTSEAILGHAARGTAHSANVVNQAAVFPFRFAFHFIRGWYTGESEPRRPITWNEFLGHSFASSFSVFLLYRSFELFSKSNPALATVYLTPMIDTITMKVCSQTAQLDDSQKQFCQNYLKTKSVFFDAASLGQLWGAQIKKDQEPNPEPSEWKGPVTDQNFCQYIQWVKANWENGPELRNFAAQSSSLLNPGGLAKPQSETYTLPDEQIRKASATQIAKLRNVVINLRPPYTSAQDASQEDAENETSSESRWSLKIAKYKRKKKLLREMTRNHDRLYREKTVEACESKKSENGFSFEDHQKLNNEIATEFYLERFLEQGDMVASAFKEDGSSLKPLIRTKLKWELVRTNTINQLREVLQDPSIGNIIFVGHTRIRPLNGPGTPPEELISDALGVIIPSDFFKKIHPNLMSIHFLVCHSGTMIRTYQIDQTLKQSESIHQKRVLSIVQSNDLLEDPEEASLNGLTQYLKTVDQTIHETAQENMMAQQFSSYPTLKPDSNCTLDIPGFQLKKGVLGIKLNQTLIGTINPAEPLARYSFDCGLLHTNGTDNTLRLYQPDSLQPQELKLASGSSKNPSRFLLNDREYNGKNTQWNNYELNENYQNTTIKFKGEL
jgi:hypothetical protein